MENNEPLKSCPFCGTPPVTHLEAGSNPCARCTECDFDFYCGSLEALANCWNRRFPIAPVVEPPATSPAQLPKEGSGAAQPVREAREFWLGMDFNGFKETNPNGQWASHCQAVSIIRADEIIRVREVLPQSAGSLEQKEGHGEDCGCLDCLRIERSGGPEPVEVNTPKLTSAVQQDCRLYAMIRAELRNAIPSISEREAILDKCFGAAGSKVNSTGSEAETGDAPAQADKAIPQKRQPDDVPRAGEDAELANAAELFAKTRTDISAYERERLLKAASRLRALSADLIRRPAALPTNAEAQAPVSAEAMEWLRQVTDGWGNYRDGKMAREILTALRTLGATPAQTKP